MESVTHIDYQQKSRIFYSRVEGLWPFTIWMAMAWAYIAWIDLVYAMDASIIMYILIKACDRCLLNQLV